MGLIWRNSIGVHTRREELNAIDTRFSNDLVTIVAIAGYALVLGIVYGMHW